MSLDFRPLREVRASDLFDGRLEKFGVREYGKADSPTQRCRALTDGRNLLAVYIDDDGLVDEFTNRGVNNCTKILAAVAVVFDTKIVCENEPQFYGFDTQEEWKEAWGDLAEQMSTVG